MVSSTSFGDHTISSQATLVLKPGRLSFGMLFTSASSLPYKADPCSPTLFPSPISSARALRFVMLTLHSLDMQQMQQSSECKKQEPHQHEKCSETGIAALEYAAGPVHVDMHTENYITPIRYGVGNDNSSAYKIKQNQNKSKESRKAQLMQHMETT